MRVHDLGKSRIQLVVSRISQLPVTDLQRSKVIPMRSAAWYNTAECSRLPSTGVRVCTLERRISMQYVLFLVHDRTLTSLNSPPITAIRAAHHCLASLRLTSGGGRRVVFTLHVSTYVTQAAECDQSDHLGVFLNEEGPIRNREMLRLVYGFRRCATLCVIPTPACQYISWRGKALTFS